MKKGKVLSLLIVLTLIISLFSGCKGAGNNASDGSKAGKEVKISFLNSKGEIQTQMEDAAKEFKKSNPNITVDVIPCSTGQSPFQKVSSMYASGNAPTLIMLDAGDIPKFKDKFADLSKMKWVKDANEGTLDAVKFDSKVKGFPLCIEGYGFIYNKAVLDKAFGGKFDPTTIKTRTDLENAFKKVEASGVASLAISPMDWSLGSHYLRVLYMDQTKENNGVDNFLSKLKSGSVDLKSNTVFNGLFDTLDMMKKYNIDKSSPLAGTYEKDQQYIGSGKVGFWFMGNWAWSLIKPFDKSNGEYGFVPVPISDNAEDYGNTQIYAGPTKYISIDKTNNNADQQAAAEKFLEWLIYNSKGQDILVNKCNAVPAFKNITMSLADPLGNSIKDYYKKKKVILNYSNIPSDHWKVLGASMQKYLDGKLDRTGLAKAIQEYWKNIK